MQKINETIGKINPIDQNLLKKTQDRLDNLTKPLGSLGRLEELAKIIVGITQKENPEFKNKVIFTFAADHGIADEKVSAFPKEVTEQMVYNFLRGQAGINILAKHIGAKVIVADLGVAANIPEEKTKSSGGNFINKKIGLGTKNFAKGPAMTREEAIKSIEAGIEIFQEEYAKGIDIIGTGEMGIANTTASSAITAVFTNLPIEEITGRGTGIDDSGLKNKIRVIKQGIEKNTPDSKDAIDVLSKVGGFEIGGLAGLILASAANKIPVVIDGFISGAAALIAYHLEPKTREYIIASHCSVEIGHQAILKHIGLRPIMDLNLRLGEGTGACLGINIAEAAIKILTQMATFKSAGVSEKI